jgi:drug/metabolite transporter (DMT)-like permease
MQGKQEFTTLVAWQRASRILISGLLLVSAMQFVAAAIVYRTLGSSDTDTLIFAGCLVLAAIALAMCVSFWRSGAPTWKHKLAIALIALPAAIGMITR